MLVLSRRKDETIVIGDDVRVTIVDIRGDTVRLGITAPKAIPVYRQEIYEAIQRENVEAAQAKPDGLDALAGAFGAMGGPAPAPPAPREEQNEDDKEPPGKK